MALTQLPYEVLIYLMKFLGLSDRQALSLSCHRLYEVYLDTHLQQDVVYVLHDNFFSAMEALRSARSEIHHLVLKELELQGETLSIWKEFWNHVEKKISTLILQNCDVSERTFINIIHSCRNLRILHLNGCNSLFISGNLMESKNDVIKMKNVLSNLKELSLANNRYLSDCLFNRLVALAPNIETLSLASCQISFHPAIYRRFYPQSRQGQASESVLTFQNILLFITQQSRKLKSLNLSRTLLDSGSLTDLAKIPNLNLRELHLGFCDQLTPLGIISLCHHQRKLQFLDLSNCVKVSNQVLLTICEYLIELKHIYLKSCHVISHDGIVGIKKLSKLLSLNLSSCEKITSEAITEGLSENQLNQLTYLNLSACSVDEFALLTICKSLHNLRHLDLSSCRKAVNDAILQVICKNALFLRTLQLAWCDKISDAGLISSDDDKTDDGSVIHGNHSNSPNVFSSSLKDLQGLKHLDLCACVMLTNKGINKGVQFQELQSLNLSLCRNISDEGIISVGYHNRSLEKLVISQCHSLTDIGILEMTKYVTRLKYLDMQGCKLLTDVCLSELPQNCPFLQYLDVSVCFGITQEGIDRLEKQMKSLREIHKRHINPITAE